MTEHENDLAVTVPKEMVNDDAYLVSAVLAGSGERVAEGQGLAELESSKASFTLYSPGAGFFYPDFSAGDMVPVGTRFGVVRAVEQAEGERTSVGAADNLPDERFSAGAWTLLQDSGLDPTLFEAMAHVRRKDVLAHLGGREGSGEAAWESLSADAKERSVVLLGGGGHCRECIDSIELAGGLDILGVVDTRQAPGSLVAGYPVLGDNSLLGRLLGVGVRNLVLAYGIAGSHAARGGHFRRLAAAGHHFPAIVHPSASVSRQASIGAGAQIMAGARVGSQAVVGEACIVNTNAVVSHNGRLGNNVHLAPGAVLAGGVAVGDDSVIGMGATVYMRVRIGAGVVVYNGADVFADVPDGAVVEGVWKG